VNVLTAIPGGPWGIIILIIAILLIVFLAKRV
jgi:hypothetical protein